MCQHRASYFVLPARTLDLQNSWQEYCIMGKTIISQDEKDLVASALGKVIMAEGIYATMPGLENAKTVVFSLSAL